jgi:hypothetical protein
MIVTLACVGGDGLRLGIAIIRRLSAAAAELHRLVMVERVLGNVGNRTVDRGEGLEARVVGRMGWERELGQFLSRSIGPLACKFLEENQ